MNTLSKVLAAAVVIVSIMSPYSANSQEWEPVEKADDGSFYTSVESAESNEEVYNSLILYAYPDSNCRVIAVAMMISDKIYEERKETFPAQWRVDRNDIMEGATIVEFSLMESEGEALSVLRLSSEATDSLIGQMSAGDKIIMRTKVGEKWTDTLRYSLSGSGRRINELLQACTESGDEWGDNANWSGKTGSTSDDSEWTL